jgi:hypothetical protein
MKDASDAPDGFLSRWSRRKAALRQGEAPPETTAPAAPMAPAATSIEPVPVATRRPASRADDRPPAPTLDDVAQLTPSSDFRRFVAADATAEVRNAALKKLFADPQFNVMDGLDIYIDDYNKFEPLTKTDLLQLVNARALGLIEDEHEARGEPDSVSLAADNVPAAVKAADENADLQLQPDDAAGQPGAGQGVAERADSDDPAPDAVPPRGA